MMDHVLMSHLHPQMSMICKMESSTRGIGGMVKLEDGKTKAKGMMQVEGVRWRGGGEGQVEGNGKGARVVKASQVEAKQVEGIQVEGRWKETGARVVEASQVEKVEERGKEVGTKMVVEAKLRGRILVKPREQMWMLQKVKVNVISSCL